jgi:SAM-dependent methyltransferase
MRVEFLKHLCCPITRENLKIQYGDIVDDVISNGMLTTENGEFSYPIVNGIPRFVSKSTYADNFGMQWNQFRKTQLDSYSGHDISSERFWKSTGWKPGDLKNKLVLDVGCGAGRFAEVALNAGAYLVALDYSTAVEACFSNLKSHKRLIVIQGDVYNLPFPKEIFDYVYTLGVLQHTPDVHKAFSCLPPMLKPGGYLCVDYYWKRFRTLMHAKYLFRPMTKRLPKEKLFRLLQIIVPIMLKTSQVLGSVPLIGVVLKRLIPVANYTGIFPLSGVQLREWALLDTFDMLSPIHDNPQTEKIIEKWFTLEGNFSDVEVFHASHLVARGKKLQSIRDVEII